MISAKDYLKNLENQYVLNEEHLKDIRLKELKDSQKKRAEQFGIKDKKILEEMYDNIGSIYSYKKYFHDDFVQALLPNLSIEERKNIKNSLFSFLPIRTFNAHTIKAPDGTPIVVLNRGLINLIHFFVEIFSIFSVIKEEKIRLLSLLALYRFSIDYFTKNGKMTIPSLIFKEYKEAAIIANSVSIAFEAFVIYHEYAHIVLNHLNNSNTVPYSRDVEFYRIKKENELAADLLAWNWFQKSKSNIKRLNEMGGGFDWLPLQGFLLMSLIEKNICKNFDFSEHPPAIYRMHQLYKLIVDPSDGIAQSFIDSAETLPDFRTMPPEMVEIIDQYKDKIFDSTLIESSKK